MSWTKLSQRGLSVDEISYNLQLFVFLHYFFETQLQFSVDGRSGHIELEFDSLQGPFHSDIRV